MSSVIRAKNVNEALVEGLWFLKAAGLKEDSRNGPVLVAPGPVITEYKYPVERVLFHPLRDANPVFHLMESLWMLAGAKHVDWLNMFNSNMQTYADDGILHGAYGYRWRSRFGIDQLHMIIAELRANPNSRRAVLAMWDATCDLNVNAKDIPCNTHIYFDLRGGALNMTVCCRSNDAVWGAYGANAVHFSVLQELLAAALGAPVGLYRQISNNFHIYVDNPQVQALMNTLVAEVYDPYDLLENTPAPLLAQGESFEAFLEDCAALVYAPKGRFQTRFFNDVAVPLMCAYLGRRTGTPIYWDSIAQCDWKNSFQEWVARRDNKEKTA